MSASLLMMARVRRNPISLAVALLIVLIVVNAALQRNFFKPGILLSNLTTFLPLMMIAVGQAFVVKGGSIDLSLGAVVSLVNVVVVVIAERVGGTGGVFAGMSCGLVAGLILTARDGAMGQAVVDTLGVPALFVAADLADPQAPAEVAGAALHRFGRIDGLVNAAGLTDRGSVLTGDVALWDRLFAVNARAPFLLMQAAIRDMVGRRAASSTSCR